jgi:hypothetical protein
MRSALTVLLVMGGLLACGGGVTGGGAKGTGTPQPGPAPASGVAGDTSPKSASLLRRLGEAADGYRDGKDKYVVADQRFPHYVVGVYDDSTEARSVAKARGGTYRVFGPFRTPVDDPPDLSGGSSDVVEVIVVRRDGERRYRADSVDALFWSLAAFDKFVVPYLAVVYGGQYAADQRELYRLGKSPFAHSAEVAHKKGSF